MTIIAPYDIETNGLLEPKRDKHQVITEPAMDRVHGVCFGLLDPVTFKGRYISACDQPGYEKGKFHYTLPDRFDPEGFPERTLIETPSHAPQGATVWERMPIADGLELLKTADIRIAHNGQDFDERALARTYPTLWKPSPKTRLLDTLLLSRLIYPDIHKTGPNKHRLFPFEQRMHGVEAWGKRLGVHKGEYTDWCKKNGIDPWSQWREEMQAYNELDVVVLIPIFKWLWAQKPTRESVDLEHDFASIIRRLESRGWAFDKEEGEELLSELQIKEAHLELQLIETFGSWWAPVRRGKAGSNEDMKKAWKDADDEDEGMEDDAEQEKRAREFFAKQSDTYQVIPTRTYSQKMVGFPDVTIPRVSPVTGKPLKPYVGPPKTHYHQGHPYTPVKLVEFNPGSRAHIWQRLMLKYNWVPVKYTPGGKNAPPQPVIDEDVLRGLPFPEANLLAEYFLVLKRIGQLATGQKSWFKFARETEHPNGSKTWRIHGRINTLGAGTFRATHSNPNLAQVPKNTAAQKDYPNSPELHGVRCRRLFIASPGYILAGFDGSALELRMLAHYISPWDGGEYADIVVNGKKELGTDPHSWLRDLIGTNLIGSGDQGRDNAKTGMYATLYGAGALKMGSIVMPTGDERERMQLGREIQAKMADRFQAKTKLSQELTKRVEDGLPIKGLDGRLLRVRKAHAVLNTLLQSAGAIVMKKALVILDRDLQASGLLPGQDYEFVGNIHDEAQADLLPQHRALYEELASQCLPKAGVALGMRCPLAAEASFGHSWAETH